MYNSSEQSRWVDVLKGIGIILVVVGHTRMPFNSFIFSFHMPLFFIVAGWLFNYTRYSQDFYTFVKKKFNRLIMPYLVSSLIIFYPFWFLLGKKYGGTAATAQDPLTQFIGIFYATGIDQWMQFNMPAWFLTCMFVSLVACWWLHRWSVGSKRRLFLLTVFVAMAGYGISFVVYLPWSIDIALVMQVFLLTGLYLRRFDFESPGWWLTALVLMGTIFANGHVDTASRHYANIFLYYVGGIAGTLLMIKISVTFDRLCTDSALERVVTFCGRNSLMILLFHSLGYKFASALFAYVFKMPLEVAHNRYWLVYALVSLCFCGIVIIVKNRLDVYMKRYVWWNRFFVW